MEPPVSGTYAGEMTAPTRGVFQLDLRVDIDSVESNSQVAHNVSGDLYQNIESSDSHKQIVYLYSWKLISLTIQESSDCIQISGEVQTTNVSNTLVRASITLALEDAHRSAKVTFTRSDGSQSEYSCVRTSLWFREIKLELAVCQSVLPPGAEIPQDILPVYDTTSLETPPHFVQRTLSVVTAFEDVGIKVSIAPQVITLNDSSPEFATWSNAELHHTMAARFSQFNAFGDWPKWNVWGILAGCHDDPTMRGMMFDTSSFGDRGDGGPRKGFAAFLGHHELTSVFDEHATQMQRHSAMRMYLRTFVHELAHTFNLRHPNENPAVHDSLASTWMNYPEEYDKASGHSGDYWRKFEFGFIQNEILHMRHGELRDVIMGGQLNTTNTHDYSTLDQMPVSIGIAPFELSIRSQRYFDLMEPVEVEVRLKNISPEDIDVDTRLNLGSGSLAIFVQRPDGRVTRFKPILACCHSPQIETVSALAPNGDGSDRRSRLLDLTYSADSFTFDAPGNYTLRASLNGKNLLVSSSAHQIRIGYPKNRDLDILAQDFFCRDVGLSLQLNVSRSSLLKRPFNLLARMVNESLGLQGAIRAKIAHRMAESMARPFFGLKNDSIPQSVEIAPRELKEAIQLADHAIDYYCQLDENQRKPHNIALASVASQKINWQMEHESAKRVSDSVTKLLETLRASGVRSGVLKSIAHRLAHTDVSSESRKSRDSLLEDGLVDPNQDWENSLDRKQRGKGKGKISPKERRRKKRK